MRSSGPVQWKASKDAIAKYSKIARTILGQLETRNALAKLTGNPWMNRVKRTLRDGTVITCWSLSHTAGFGPIRIIKIDAEPTAAAIIVYPHYGIESGLILFYVDDAGLGQISVADTTTFPLNIYTGSELATYLEGTGSELPLYIERRFLIWGYREADPVGPCLAWPDSFSLGSDKEYVSEGFTSAGALESTTGHKIDPCWFSGKLRLAAQAKLNAGISIQELGPDSWLTGVHPNINSTISSNDGLFHDGNYNYWLIRVNINGCRAVRLDIGADHSEIECVRTTLRDYTVDDEDIPRLEAYILSALVAIPGSEIEVLTAAELDDVYSDEAVPLYNGWKYSHQQNTSTTEASIVTLRVHPSSTSTAVYYQSVLASLEFTVSETDVSAVLAVEETSTIYPHPGYDRVFIPVLGQLCWWNNATVYGVPVGTDAALYCVCYDKQTDSREVLRYTYVATTTVGAITNSYPLTACDPGDYYEERQQSSSKHKWTLDVNFEGTVLVGTGYLFQYLKRDWGWETTAPALPGGCDHPISGSPCTGTPGCCTAGVSDNSGFCTAATKPGANSDCFQTFGNKVSAWLNHEHLQYYNGTGRTVVAIPDGDCEAVYVTSYQTGDGLSSKESGSVTNPTAFTRVQYYNHNTGEWGTIGKLLIDFNGAGDGIIFCDTSTASHTTGAVSLSTVNGAREDAMASLITAHGLTELDISTATNWDIGPDVSASEPCLGYSLYTQASANLGDTYYWSKPGTAELSGNYQFDSNLLTGTTRRFIGHA